MPNACVAINDMSWPLLLLPPLLPPLPLPLLPLLQRLPPLPSPLPPLFLPPPNPANGRWFFVRGPFSRPGSLSRFRFASKLIGEPLHKKQDPYRMLVPIEACN